MRQFKIPIFFQFLPLWYATALRNTSSCSDPYCSQAWGYDYNVTDCSAWLSRIAAKQARQGLWVLVRYVNSSQSWSSPCFTSSGVQPPFALFLVGPPVRLQSFKFRLKQAVGTHSCRLSQVKQHGFESRYIYVTHSFAISLVPY